MLVQATRLETSSFVDTRKPRFWCSPSTYTGVSYDLTSCPPKYIPPLMMYGHMFVAAWDWPQ